MIVIIFICIIVLASSQIKSHVTVNIFDMSLGKFGSQKANMSHTTTILKGHCCHMEICK